VDGTLSAQSKVSLLDLIPGRRYFEWYVVYYPRQPHYFWAKYLKQGFRHCEVWRPYSFGAGPDDQLWLHLTPNFEIFEAGLDFDPRPPWGRIPGCTVQRVRVLSTAYKVRQWCHVGPITCTEFCKAALGINSFWLRTPHQLYQHIRKLDGVIRA